MIDGRKVNTEIHRPRMRIECLSALGFALHPTESPTPCCIAYLDLLEQRSTPMMEGGEKGTLRINHFMRDGFHRSGYLHGNCSRLDAPQHHAPLLQG